MKQPFLILFTILFACSNQTTDNRKLQIENQVLTDETSYVWTKLLDSADWKKSYNFQMFSFRDTLWTFHSDGNWFSINGINWTKSSLPNSIYNLAFLDYVSFKDAVYGLGHFEGNIEQFTLRNEIYKTTDLRKWETITQTNLPKRFFYHPFEFQNKLWIIGGEDKERKYSDIWNSDNALTWIKQKEKLPYGYNDGGQFLLFKGKLFMFRSDVWSSTNGLSWEQVTPAIVPGENVFGYTPVVFDNKIWLLGCNRNEQFTSQVFVSEDGKTWRGQEAPWSPRGGIAASVYKGKIYMTGGKYGGTPNHPEFRYDNDVWTMEKK